MSMRKDFLIQCRKRNLFPAHIGSICNKIYYLIESNTPFNRKLDNITNNYKKQLLNLEIDITFYKLKTLRKNLETYRSFNTEKSSNIFYSVFFDYQFAFIEKLRSIDGSKYSKKLEKLSNKYMTPNISAPIDIVNLSNTTIPDIVKTIMSYRSKFALNMNKLNTTQLFRLISDIESILNTRLKDIPRKNSIRSELVNIISNFMNSPSHASCSQEYMHQ